MVDDENDDGYFVNIYQRERISVKLVLLECAYRPSSLDTWFLATSSC